MKWYGLFQFDKFYNSLSITLNLFLFKNNNVQYAH